MKASKIISLVFSFIVVLLCAAMMYMRADSVKQEQLTNAAVLQTHEPVSANAGAPELTVEQTTEPTAEPTPDITPEPTPEPTPEATPEPEPAIPQIDIESWEYILANHWNGIGEYIPQLTTIKDPTNYSPDHKFDERAAGALNDFLAAARAQGLSVYLSSAYRDYNEQSYTYRNKVSQVGEATAWTIVAVPGTSEHQTGLSADITDHYYPTKDRSLENTALYQWMSKHCQEYGFIVRYPDGKGDVTGVIYEPWHFRYVGVEAATYIMENGLAFEEFVQLYKEINLP